MNENENFEKLLKEVQNNIHLRAIYSVIITYLSGDLLLAQYQREYKDGNVIVLVLGRTLELSQRNMLLTHLNTGFMFGKR